MNKPGLDRCDQTHGTIARLARKFRTQEGRRGVARSMHLTVQRRHMKLLTTYFSALIGCVQVAIDDLHHCHPDPMQTDEATRAL